MLLGKRPRPPVMRRTRSMSGGMAVDTQATEASNLEAHEEVVMSDSLHPHPHDEDVGHGIKDPQAVVMGTQHGGLVADQTKNVSGAKGYEYDERLVGTVMFPSPTTTITNNHRQNQTSNPAHAIHTAHDFLRTCGLCRCRLAPGRDIYMYRGDTAFCSLECREKQMKQDQRKEKWKGVSNKDHRVSPPPTATTKASTKSETAACS